MDIEELKSQVIININNLSQLNDEEKEQRALKLLNELNALLKEGKIVSKETKEDVIPVKEEGDDAESCQDSVTPVELLNPSPPPVTRAKKHKRISHDSKIASVTESTESSDTEEALVKDYEAFEKRTDGWYCLYCARKFNSRANVKVHLRTHTGEKPFKCDICQRSFAVKVNYSRHVKRHSDDSPHKCDWCSKSYTEKRHLDQHVKVNHTVDPITGQTKEQRPPGRVCEECGKTFTSPYYLKVHILSHRGEYPHECEFCGKKFRHLWSFRQHQRQTHPHQTQPLPFTCNVCLKSFSREAWLLRHQKKLHASDENVVTSKAFSCPQCNKVFDTRQLMMVHRADEHSRWFVCRVCEQRFLWRYLLNEHVNSAHGTSTQRFPCSQCHRSFSRKSGLKRHHNCHEQREAFNCKECGRSYSYKSSLVTHVNTHSSEPHACSQCGQNFALPAGLQRHLAYHKAERPFECNVCGKTFVIKGDLTRHKKVHSKASEATNTETEFLLIPNNTTDQAANQEIVFLQTDSNQPIFLNGRSFEELVIEAPPEMENTDSIMTTDQQLFQCERCNTTFANEYSMNKHATFCTQPQDSTMRSILLPSTSEFHVMEADPEDGLLVLSDGAAVVDQEVVVSLEAVQQN